MSGCGVLCEGVDRIIAWVVDGSFWHRVIFFVLGSSSPDPFSSEYRREGEIGKTNEDRGRFSSEYRREGEIGKTNEDRGRFSSEYRREGEIGKTNEDRGRFSSEYRREGELGYSFGP